MSQTFVFMKETNEIQKIFLTQLGKKIKEIRIKKGLSQSELANLSNKERQSYQRVEAGNVNPTVWYLYNLSCALNIDIREFFDQDFPNPQE